MEFSAPTNWQKELITGLLTENLNGEVKELYGKLDLDDIGGGRAASALPYVSKKNAQKHIKELHNNGFKFNYLLNALCMDNLELTYQGHKKIRHLLDWLVKIGVDSITVANPYIMKLAKKNYPTLSISVSAMANTDTIHKAMFWEDLGADKITFPGPAVNRNFPLIRNLRRLLKCKIQLIANNACLIHCATATNHSLTSCHASQKWHKCKGYMFDYYLIMCRLRSLENIINFIRADWIRPEDVTFYEGLGADSIKLVDRRLSTAAILKIIDAYIKKEYHGNLVDLFPNFQGKSFNANKGWINKFLYLWRPLLSMNLIKIVYFSRSLSKLQISIDNQELDGFISGIPQDCDLISCDRCGYCKITAERAVRIDTAYLRDTIKQYKETLERLFLDGLS